MMGPIFHSLFVFHNFLLLPNSVWSPNRHWSHSNEAEQLRFTTPKTCPLMTSALELPFSRLSIRIWSLPSLLIVDWSHTAPCLSHTRPTASTLLGQSRRKQCSFRSTQIMASHFKWSSGTRNIRQRYEYPVTTGNLPSPSPTRCAAILVQWCYSSHFIITQ